MLIEEINRLVSLSKDTYSQNKAMPSIMLAYKEDETGHKDILVQDLEQIRKALAHLSTTKANTALLELIKGWGKTLANKRERIVATIAIMETDDQNICIAGHDQTGQSDATVFEVKTLLNKPLSTSNKTNDINDAFWKGFTTKQ